jgi:adenosine deaminase
VLDGVTTALNASQDSHGISTGLIITMLRDLTADSAMHTLEQILRIGTPILGIGLDSAEVGHPPSKFRTVFDRAHAEGLHTVAHAGEEGPPAYIWEALDLLGAERIDHGVRCLEDQHLVTRLVDTQTPLTVCPLSNVRLKVVDQLADHPLPRMLTAGLLVTVHSDDPAYFGGYVDDNYTAIAATLGLDDTTLADLARNSIKASFIDQQRRTALLAEIDAATDASPA